MYLSDTLVNSLHIHLTGIQVQGKALGMMGARGSLCMRTRIVWLV